MTEDTRREKNRAISMFQTIRLTARQVMKANRAMPRRLGCLTKTRVTSALSQMVATWSLQLLWPVIGGFMGTSQVFLISGAAGTLDYVSLCNRGQVWECICSMLWWQSEVMRDDNHTASPVDLSFGETSPLSFRNSFALKTCCSVLHTSVVGWRHSRHSSLVNTRALFPGRLTNSQWGGLCDQWRTRD